jgi:hypothetical protein
VGRLAAEGPEDTEVAVPSQDGRDVVRDEDQAGAAVPAGTSGDFGGGGPDVVVEIGGARIRVGRGADLALVGDVVRALQGGGR